MARSHRCGVLVLLLSLAPVTAAADYASQYTGHDGVGRAGRHASCAIRIHEATVELRAGVKASLVAYYGRHAFEQNCVGYGDRPTRHVYRLEGAALHGDRLRMDFSDCGDPLKRVVFDGTVDDLRLSGSYRFIGPHAAANHWPWEEVDVRQTLVQFVQPYQPSPASCATVGGSAG